MAAKPFSLSLGTKLSVAKLPPRKDLSTPSKKRAFASHDSDPESETEGAAQEVSAFDLAAGGAINEKHKKEIKAPLVIKARSDLDWREQARRKRQKAALPGQEAQNGRNVDVETAEKEEKERLGKTSLGLNIMRAQEQDEHQLELSEDDTMQVELQNTPAMTEDERALAALKGEKVKSDLVIAAVPKTETEEEAFHEDYEEAPDAPSQADYARIPVEEFGAALLRGMGWKDGEDLGGKPSVKPEEVKRRPALLGIGAKSEAATGVELGSWEQSGKGKTKVSKRAIDQEFTPVVLQNKRTGERLSEEQLKERLAKEAEQGQMVFAERNRSRERRSPDRYYERSSKRYRADHDEDHRSKQSKRSRKDRRHDDIDEDRDLREPRRSRSRSQERSDRYRSKEDKYSSSRKSYESSRVSHDSHSKQQYRSRDRSSDRQSKEYFRVTHDKESERERDRREYRKDDHRRRDRSRSRQRDYKHDRRRKDDR